MDDLIERLRRDLDDLSPSPLEVALRWGKCNSAARESAASPDKLPLLRSRPGGVRLPDLHGP